MTNELAGCAPARAATRPSSPTRARCSATCASSPSPTGAATRELLLDTERVALQALFDMIRRFKVGYEVELHKRTSSAPAVADRTRRAARRGRRRRWPAAEHSNAPVEIDGVAALAVRTDLGVDLSATPPSRSALTRGAARRGAAAVCRDGRRDACASSAGGPRYGIDLDDTVIPQEAGLNERAVSFTKGCYVGQETVARLLLQGQAQPPPARPAPVGAAPQPASELRLGERVVGQLGSSAPSPRASARSAWRSCAARPSRAARWRSASRAQRRGGRAARSLPARAGSPAPGYGRSWRLSRCRVP